jgi:hypothetical protein
VNIFTLFESNRHKEHEGRCTRNIKDHEVMAPRRLNQDGDFLSYSLPQFYKHDPSRRRKRSLSHDSEKVHYGLTFDGKDHHVELWPKHYFISPGMMKKERGVGGSEHRLHKKSFLLKKCITIG